MHLAFSPQALSLAHSLMSMHSPPESVIPDGQLHRKPPGVLVHWAPSAHGLFEHSSISVGVVCVGVQVSEGGRISGGNVSKI